MEPPHAEAPFFTLSTAALDDTGDGVSSVSGKNSLLDSKGGGVAV